jgi:protocatechuate 3,4-dioxygenase beta subunit
LKLQKTFGIVAVLLILSVSVVASGISVADRISAFAQPANPNLTNRPPSEPPDFQELAASQKASSTNSTCTLSTAAKLRGTPQQTEGPYFVDGMPNRSDIRSDTLNNVIEKGVKLSLMVHIYGIDNGSCVPIKGAKVDIWHANSQGIYSAVTEMGTSDNNFLRGYQMTDNNGTAKFTTIYPGWYQGRSIHIHDKVRTVEASGNNLEWTSQIYFNDSLNDQIHKLTPYSSHGPPQTPDDQDMIFTGPSTDDLVKSNSGKLLLMNVTVDGKSEYKGVFNIVLNAK